jgi:Lrp/AsnC family transcriptional regulator, leucine-responsive regulatory protein
MTFGLDSFDVRLLNLVQADNQLTAEVLSRHIGLSPSSVLRRLNRLRESGLIACDVAVASDVFLERRASGLISIQLARQTPEAVQGLKRQLGDCPEVQLLFEVSGAFDLLALVVERDLAAFHAFTDRTLARSPYVQRFETTFVKSRLKATLAVPLDGRDAH